MEQAMKRFAINAPTPEMLKASYQDRRANIIRVTYNTGVVLVFGTGTVFAIYDTLWSLIPGAVGGLLFIVGLAAAYEFARGPGWSAASLTLPSNSFTLKAGAIVMLAILGAMTFVGDKLGLSVSQWGQLGLFSYFFTYYVSGLCVLFWPRRNDETGAAPLVAS
jgi:hypothetical protein